MSLKNERSPKLLLSFCYFELLCLKVIFQVQRVLIYRQGFSSYCTEQFVCTSSQICIVQSSADCIFIYLIKKKQCFKYMYLESIDAHNIIIKIIGNIQVFTCLHKYLSQSHFLKLKLVSKSIMKF